MNTNQTKNQMDKELKLVHQFLIDHDFENTADALMVEATIKGFKHCKKDLQIESDIYENYYEQLMFSYKTGDWRTFFNLWNLIISEDVRQTKSCKILMLHIYVYFAMLPKRIKYGVHIFKKFKINSMTETEKNMNDSMEQLRNFLNTTGKELEKDSDLRPYFALPFMEDPYAEPFLSKIFEKSWSNKLTNHLQLFLKKYKQQSFSDTKYNDENSNKFSSSYTSLSEDLKKDVMTKKTIKNTNVPIIPNDRNIPIFLENDELEGQFNLYDNIKCSQKSKSIQTVSINSSEEDMCSSHFTRKNKKLIQCTQELAVTKSHLCSVHSNYEKLKVRFHKLHADYHKLMSIARILTTALEDSVKGQAIDFQAMLETCIKIFPDLFNQNIKDSSHCSSELLLDKSHSNMKTIEYSNSYNVFIPPKLLDFKKIKLHLINGSIKTKLFLLQALRRKITFSQSGERDETVHEYISKDLLGLHSQIASYRGKSILPYLLTSQNIIIPHPLQQSVARLLNALASFRCGRDYLSFDSTVVDMVFKCLNSISNNDIDTLTCNMMIAMLQKLSLRKQQRIYMIENGLVEWLIHHLYDQCRVIDSYRLEYATALLMNLSLHQVAQKRASALAPLLISTLVDLLLMDHISALPYINGALNNFLTNPSINEEARRIKFSSIIEQYSKYKTGEIRKHLDHILKIHRGEITIKTEDEDMADNDNEEFDVLETQLEENDPVKNNYGELCGESLLESCYTILPKAINKNEIIPDELSFSQKFKTEATNSAMHNNQIKSLSSELLKNSVEKTMLYPKSQPRVIELKYSSTKEISKLQIAENKKWNSMNDKNLYTFVKETHNESAMYLYENHTSNNGEIQQHSVTVSRDSNVIQTHRMILNLVYIRTALNAEDGNKIANDKIPWTQETISDTEEAFLAKPKLARTPP
ncbi:hypothetical protein E2986_01824 [Frieseomelitta varia]|uniref:LisH domain-containing protein ARMC9 n=1 Tax=Frieseomelitta varia TaxID=561572 RepID=A0A833R4L9_9HYME|nr:hypothetical protein E2986_01824 [Frieseomelitta varia]